MRLAIICYTTNFKSKIFTHSVGGEKGQNKLNKYNFTTENAVYYTLHISLPLRIKLNKNVEITLLFVL